MLQIYGGDGAISPNAGSLGRENPVSLLIQLKVGAILAVP
jgi:hypothetical protein